MSYRRHDALPPSLPPRGLTRSEAAAYIGVSPGTFDSLVKRGQMPAPLYYTSRPRWDRKAIDLALDRLSALSERNPHDEDVPNPHDEDVPNPHDEDVPFRKR